MSRQIILDTETTGLSPAEGDRVIEIGCLEMVNRRLTGDSYHCYINPERSIDREAQEVHGITDDFLKDKPLFTGVIDEFIDYIEGADLIIHNAPFDVNFLDHEFKWAGKQYKKITNYCNVIDTLVLARRKHPGQHNSLDALCRRYHVDNSNRELHGALIDVELLAQVYLLMTGGQGQLFQAQSGSQNSQQQAEVGIRRLDSNRKPLKVIYATKDELAAHENF